MPPVPKSFSNHSCSGLWLTPHHRLCVNLRYLQLAPSRQHSDRTQKRSAKKILKNLCGLCGSARYPAAQPPHVPPTNTTCGRACLGTARILTIKYTRRRSSAPTRQRSDPRPNPSIAPHAPLTPFSIYSLGERPPPYPYITWPGWPTCSKKPHIH